MKTLRHKEEVSWLLLHVVRVPSTLGPPPVLFQPRSRFCGDAPWWYPVPSLAAQPEPSLVSWCRAEALDVKSVPDGPWGMEQGTWDWVPLSQATSLRVLIQFQALC